jgi:bifunctional DNA-binding transcriptional regulator/antitoxin component of YhaV-PrlF toxin-antitoxin module
MSEKVKRRRGYTRLSRKHQVTIPADVVRAAGLEPGDEMRVEVDDTGRIVRSPTADPIDEFAGSLPGVYPPGYLNALRDEWDRRNPPADLDALSRDDG